MVMWNVVVACILDYPPVMAVLVAWMLDSLSMVGVLTSEPVSKKPCVEVGSVATGSAGPLHVSVQAQDSGTGPMCTVQVGVCGYGGVLAVPLSV